eukprot:CAMPEP_0113887394 /NCGR_PEP_ID=MMETSP0780_2-20120614/12189_1 /TAXON_ID=652834 /ORGANISM="Palpitomonas bilix" /LENGTH=371 /DNA_ID=CAMNT_0000875921 /DNA_START=44 /DNA_END=1160 /DNA_ORIENTATION=- /assembly_acc=CAM_ASM_000599
MTAVTGGMGGPSLRLTGSGSEADIAFDFTQSDYSMSEISSVFPPTLTFSRMAGWALGPSGFGLYQGEGSGGVSLTAIIDELAAEWGAKIEEEGWPAISISIGDEPPEYALEGPIAAARAIRAAGHPKVKSNVFSSLSNVEDGRFELAKVVDTMILTHHDPEALHVLNTNESYSNTEYMLYNLARRYRVGFYLYRMVQPDMKCKGHLQFMYSSVGADPYYALDAREDDICAVFSSSATSSTTKEEMDTAGARWFDEKSGIVETLWLRSYREGVDDYRYARALEVAVEEGRVAEGDAEEAESILAFLQSLPVGHNTAELSWRKLNEIRRSIGSILAKSSASTSDVPNEMYIAWLVAAVLSAFITLLAIIMGRL